MQPGLCHLPPQMARQAAKSDVLEGRCVFIHLKKKKICKSHYCFLLYFPLCTSFFFASFSPKVREDPTADFVSEIFQLIRQGQNLPAVEILAGCW